MMSRYLDTRLVTSRKQRLTRGKQRPVDVAKVVWPLVLLVIGPLVMHLYPYILNKYYVGYNLPRYVFGHM